MEARRAGLRAERVEADYDEGRRVACDALLAGPVRAGAARRLVELVLGPREHADELAEIFDEIDDLAHAPTLPELTGVAARATAAHTCRGTRSLTVSLAAISAGLDRRFAACESGEAAYPLTLSGLGAAGRYGLEHRLSRVYLTHVLERIVESALLVVTVVDPACAPGAYAVTVEPRRSTTASVRCILAGHLVCDQNATIDFALEELTSRYRRAPMAVDHLQALLTSVRPPIDVGQLVVAAHGLASSTCEDISLDAELAAAAGILDGSGLTGEGSLALGAAVGAIMGIAAGLVSTLPTSRGRTAGGGDSADGGDGGGDPARSGGERARGGAGGAVPDDLARSALRMALVIAWCARHGRVRPGAITIDDRAPGGC